MSEPIKNNEHILSNQQDFQQAYARAREYFGKIEGVVGVGFGLKETGGQNTDNIAFVVYVREKKSEEEIAPEQRIPPVFEGYRTDVQVMREFIEIACDNTSAYDVIQGGIQIAPKAFGGSMSFGTLGCIVKKRNDSGRENVYLLSNQHVLYANGDAADEYIYHPNPPNAGPSTALGPILPFPFHQNVSFRMPDPAHTGQFLTDDYWIDCAIARIDLDSKCCGSTCTKDTTQVGPESIIDLALNGVNTISDVRNVINDPSIIYTNANPRKVFKVGRTTGRTVGKVTAIGFSNATWKNLIRIDFDTTSTGNGLNCKGKAAFVDHGDSGSLLVDEQGRAIGLVNALVTTANADGSFSSTACHIVPILDNLGICVPTTTGTSHGSSRATDGSGVALSPQGVLGDFPLGGQIGFASQQVTGELARADALRAPAPVTEDEERHMRELLAGLRATEKGRELHFVFGEVRREVGYLVRNVRPVKAAWLRNKGPAYLAHVLNHLKGHTDTIPEEVDGVSTISLLTKMGDMLSKHGSHPLRRAIEQHGADLIQMLAYGRCKTAQDCIAYLQQKESV